MNSISLTLIVAVLLIVISLAVIVASLLALWLTREKPKAKIDLEAAVRNAPYYLLEGAGVPIARSASRKC